MRKRIYGEKALGNEEKKVMIVRSGKIRKPPKFGKKGNKGGRSGGVGGASYSGRSGGVRISLHKKGASKMIKRGSGSSRINTRGKV